jgi:5-methylcytosine-specific restriction protein B
MPRDKKEVFEGLKSALQRGLANGTLLTQDQIDTQLRTFRDRFGPEALRGLDGVALLQSMHGRTDGESRCLAYWLEFKDDAEFAGNRFGGIGGGSALKFGLFQRKQDAAWITGSATNQKVISTADAIEIARNQKAQLLTGSAVLASFDIADLSDKAYARLQSDMEKAAPELAYSAWAHKYWFLVYPDRLDDYHSPRYQRFHLLKLLQLPPDGAGILDGGAPRFVCAGRFVSAAKQLEVPVSTLNTVLNQRDSALHRYWRVGTTEGDTGESHWPVMRSGGFVSIGWSHLGNLSPLLGEKTAKEKIKELLLHEYQPNPGVGTRKAGEILNFAQEMAENDIVLACDGQTVLGIGRVRGPYEFDDRLKFPHKRAVEWLSDESWSLPEQEGLRTTVFELGKHPQNILELEQRLFEGRGLAPTSAKVSTQSATPALSPLDPFAVRVDAILKRKGQVIFYGPPGTGKTYRAVNVARDLAARHAFGKRFADLSSPERAELEVPSGLVRLCTFHPGYGYEDFMEGLRPRTKNDQMVFEPRDGIFKDLCRDATSAPKRQFYLVVDEINRGDVPRIFGELLTVIEQDKRGRAVMLPVTRSSFVVPPNVFLIGTMNTADRSISLLDAALRRRFGFIELMPDSSALADRKAGSLPLGAWLDALNARIRKNLKRDARNLQIGHAYLMPSPPITSIAEFARILRDDVIPLLEEYCYDDFKTLADILGKDLVDADAGRVREEIFEANREQDLILAVSFEEMQLLTLDQRPADELTGSDGIEQDAGST